MKQFDDEDKTLQDLFLEYGKKVIDIDQKSLETNLLEFLNNQKDIDPEYSEIVDKYFWDLLTYGETIIEVKGNEKV